MLYRSLTTLARALAQYLAVLSRLPGRLQLPPEKEPDTVKFVVTTLEVSGHSGTRCLCDWHCHVREEGTFHRNGSCAVQGPLHLIPTQVAPVVKCHTCPLLFLSAFIALITGPS